MQGRYALADMQGSARTHAQSAFIVHGSRSRSILSQTTPQLRLWSRVSRAQHRIDCPHRNYVCGLTGLVSQEHNIASTDASHAVRCMTWACRCTDSVTVDRRSSPATLRSCSAITSLLCLRSQPCPRHSRHHRRHQLQFVPHVTRGGCLQKSLTNSVDR
jgi:hypothetical protein